MMYGFGGDQFVLIGAIVGIISPFVLIALKLLEMTYLKMKISEIIDRFELFFSLAITSCFVFLLYLMFFSSRLQIEYENDINWFASLLYILGVTLMVISTRYYNKQKEE